LATLALQVSPTAGSAYFKEYLEVAGAELQQVLGDVPLRFRRVGPLDFIELDADGLDREQLLRLSFAQGLYEVDGEQLRPLDLTPRYRLHEDFVFGSKYRGKTSEQLTQLLINVGLSALGGGSGKPRKLLDPMCGRGTTLLWAMRYGMVARGIEQDARALADLRASIRKWCKLHRQKHRLSEGSVGRASRDDTGRFLEFDAADTNLRIVIGDTGDTAELLGGERFDLLVSDLPYGVQHRTTRGSRNPLSVIEQSLPSWLRCLKDDGVIVLAFNSYQPRRDALVKVFEAAGLEAGAFSARHRMSESIVRDVAVFTRPRSG
jgi:SAM-dependent methyltransferase